jgi:hypothetical protein
MDLEVASSEQVIEWFEARPEYKELLIEDMRKKLGLHFLKEFKYVFDHTDFLVHPGVGLIPTYILENLVDPTFEVSADSDDFQRCIWQSLWFCTIQKTDHGGDSLFFEPLEDFARIQFECEMELQTYWDNIESYLNQWRTLEFSNRKQFMPLADLSDIKIDELYESKDVVEWLSPSGLSDFGYSANVLEDENGKIFVHINANGHFLMEVASNDEAEKILNEIWG